MCSVIREGRAAPQHELMPMFCGGKEWGAGKGTRPGRGSLELGSDSFGPFLCRAFGASVCKFSPFRRVSVKKLGQGGGITHSSEVWLHFPFPSPICFAAGMAWGPAETVGNSTFLASSCHERELMINLSFLRTCSGGLRWPGICPV